MFKLGLKSNFYDLFSKCLSKMIPSRRVHDPKRYQVQEFGLEKLDSLGRHIGISPPST